MFIAFQSYCGIIHPTDEFSWHRTRAAYFHVVPSDKRSFQDRPTPMLTPMKAASTPTMWSQAIACLVLLAWSIAPATADTKKTDPHSTPPATTHQTLKTPDTAPAKTGPNDAAKEAAAKPDQPVTLDQFLDRLMIAESGGRATAKNPRSSATGAFQFIASTWLSVMESHFPQIGKDKSRAALLALRNDPEISRKAAAAYTRELAASLRNAGLKDTFVNLRLAYLLGPSGGVRLLQANDKQRVSAVVSRPALRANPFLARLTVGELRARAKRDLSLTNDPQLNLKLPKGTRKRAAGPRIRVRCNLSRPSCKRWLALQKRKARVKSQRKARKQATSNR